MPELSHGGSRRGSPEDGGPSRPALLGGSAADLPTEAGSRATDGGEPRRTASPRAREMPSAIGRFKILRELGSGGMGFVLVGRDEQLHRDVAIKVLRAERSSPRDRQRLEREAQALAQLSDPHVVPIFEVGDHDGELYIAMELVVGDSLRTWARNGERTWQEILAVYLQAARGLAAAHSRGLVHRDFKPENALVGDDGRVRVVDFGLVAEAEFLAADEATATTSTDDVLRTHTGEFLGTPRYMAPEQFVGGHVGPAADQFAWCVALFEALSKTRPFAGSSVSELATAVTSDLPRALPAGAYPRALGPVIERGLARVPSRRHASMNELIATIERVTARRIPWRTLAIGVAAAGVVGAWFATRPIDAMVVVETKVPEPAAKLLVGPDNEPQRRAQAPFAEAHAAMVQGDYEMAALRFDDAAAAYELAYDDGEDLARIQLDRALAHFAAWKQGRAPARLVVAQELLRRTVENYHRHPHPEQLQAKATEVLTELESHTAELASARGVDDPSTRFHLVRFDAHPPGTKVETPSGVLCIEPCSAPLAAGSTVMLRYSRSGYHDVMSFVRIPGLGSTIPPTVPMRAVMPNETYEPRTFEAPFGVASPPSE